MQPYYINQRDWLADQHKQTVERALMYYTNQVKAATEGQLNKRKLLDEVTEAYVRRGFVYFGPHGYNYSVGGHRTTSTYLRRIAKDMKRPFIEVNETSAAYISMPRTKKLTPLVASLIMVASETYDPDVDCVFWNKQYTSLYCFTLRGKNWGKHPLFTWWLNEMNTNAEWRRLFNA